MILLFKPDTFENSVCQDETDQNESSNQGLHILPLCSRFTLLAATDVSKHRDGRVYNRNSRLKGLIHFHLSFFVIDIEVFEFLHTLFCT